MPNLLSAFRLYIIPLGMANNQYRLYFDSFSLSPVLHNSKKYIVSNSLWWSSRGLATLQFSLERYIEKCQMEILFVLVTNLFCRWSSLGIWLFLLFLLLIFPNKIRHPTNSHIFQRSLSDWVRLEKSYLTHIFFGGCTSVEPSIVVTQMSLQYKFKKSRRKIHLHLMD